MNLRIEQRLTTINFTDKNDIGRIKYIVIHYFGSLGSAAAVANYFKSAYRGASAHYALDEGDIVYQCVDDGDIAWHCGTKGTYVHPYCRNSNSIGIEVRPYKIDPSTAADAMKKDWYFTDKTIDNLVVFTKYLMKKYDVSPENVVRHYDVTGKWCPRPYMGDDINEYWHVTGNEMWRRFKERISSEEEQPDMSKITQEEFNKMFATAMSEYRKSLRDNDSGNWSAEARQYVEQVGLFAGNGTLDGGKPNMMWEDFLTREQAAQLFYRFSKILGVG